MSQNTSHAVMQQRSEAHDSLDDFPTPPWATRALFKHVILPNLGLVGALRLKALRAWEPCANRGFMYVVLNEYFAKVAASDIHDYGMGYVQHDFLMPYIPEPIETTGVSWIVTNPPFRLGEQIIQRARNIASNGVAVLVRSAFLEGVDRYNTLFSISPPTLVAQFSERVIMHKGVLRDPNIEYLDPVSGKMKRPSTATSYTWLVWMAGRDPQPMIWIPPCRRLLEREGDYPNA
jgi:hypothetical protein